jgi:hypothetical protein
LLQCGVTSPARISAKTLPFSAISKSLICFILPAAKFSPEKDLRKIFHSDARYTQPNSHGCSPEIKREVLLNP